MISPLVAVACLDDLASRRTFNGKKRYFTRSHGPVIGTPAIRNGYYQCFNPERG